MDFPFFEGLSLEAGAFCVAAETWKVFLWGVRGVGRALILLLALSLLLYYDSQPFILK